MSATTLQRDQLALYWQPVDAVLAALGTDARLGLSGREAWARFERYGKNELTAEKPVPAWRKFLAQFQDVLVIAGMLKEAPTETTPLQKELSTASASCSASSGDSLSRKQRV